MKALEDLVRPEMPAERLGSLRVLIGLFALVYCVARAPALASVSRLSERAFAPGGPVRLLDAPLSPDLVWLLLGATIAAGGLFVAGYAFRVVGPVFAALLLWVTSYRNSFGMIFHTENLFVLHVVLLGLSPAADAVAWGRPATGETSRSYGAAVVRLSLLTTLAYVLAGVAKLRVSGEHWLGGEILVNHIAHDNLRKLLLGDGYSVIGGFLVAHPWVFKPLAWLTVVFELGAPLALLSTRLAKVICGGLWLFHFGVLLVMWILFPYPLLGLAFASFFRAEEVLAWVRRRVPKVLFFLREKA